MILLISLGVSALGFLQLDNRQQEIRLTVLEKEHSYMQKRLDLVSKRLLAIGHQWDTRPPQQLYEEEGP